MIDSLEAPIVKEQEENPTEVKDLLIYVHVTSTNRQYRTIVIGMGDLIAKDKTLITQLRRTLQCRSTVSIDPDTQQEQLILSGDHRMTLRWFLQDMGIPNSAIFEQRF